MAHIGPPLKRALDALPPGPPRGSQTADRDRRHESLRRASRCVSQANCEDGSLRINFGLLAVPSVHVAYALALVRVVEVPPATVLALFTVKVSEAE